MFGKNYRWFVSGLIFILYTTAAAHRSCIGIALPFIKEEFVLSNAEAGAIISAFTLTYACSQIPAGLLYTRFGIWRLFSLAMLATSVFTGMMGFAYSAAALYLWRFCLGIAQGPLPVGCTSTTNRWFPPNEKGIATGIYLAAAKAGPAIVPIASALLLESYGWRNIFIFFATPGAIMALAWWILVRDNPSECRFCSDAEANFIENSSAPTATADSTAQPVRDLGLLDRIIRAVKFTPLESNKNILRSWDIWGCALAYFCMVGVVHILTSWIPTYLISVKKFTIVKAGFVASAPWIGAILGNLIGGWISDKWLNERRKPLMILSSFFTAIMLVVMINAPSSPMAYASVLFIMGILLNLGYAAYMVYPMGIADKKRYPFALSIVNSSGNFGGMCATLAVGFILDASGWGSVFAFMVGVSLFSILVLLSIKEPLREQPVRRG